MLPVSGCAGNDRRRLEYLALIGYYPVAAVLFGQFYSTMWETAVRQRFARFFFVISLAGVGNRRCGRVGCRSITLSISADDE